MSSQPLQSTSTNQPQSLLKKLTIKDLANLQNILYKAAPKAFDFGLQLGVEYPTLCKIKKNYRDVEDQFREVLAHRLSQLPPLTWHDILQALRCNAVQMDQLASEIESKYLSQPIASASSLVSCTHTHNAPLPSTPSQSTPQPSPSTPIAGPHPPPQPAPQNVYVYVYVDDMPPQSPQLLLTQPHPPRHPSCPPPSNPLMSISSQPQAESAQPPSISQPSSSQLMSVPVTSQAMPGSSPQLSQDVATPHHLQVGEQQALQGQPPLQHVPSHEPQTVAQSYDTGSDSGPSQAKHVYSGSPMAQYINYVKTIYRKSVVAKKSVSIKWPPTPSKVFINFVCVDRTADLPKEEADECTKAMVCDGSMDVILKKKTPIDFSDIARNVPDSKTLILVEGAPGVGKSTFAWEFCRRWEKGEIAQQYQLVLLLRLRDERVSKAQSLADLILHPSHDIRQAVVQELECTLGANTLIILDGFDELPSTCRTQSSVFLQLSSGELLPNATLLVTSRPWATQDIHKECRDHIFQHIEILGFTSDQIEEYVTSVFMDKKKPASDKDRENVKEVMSYIGRYPQIKACTYIPLNAAIVVSVYQETQSKAGECTLPRTLTQLYYTLTRTLLLRYLYGHPEYGQRCWKIQSLKEDLPQDVYSQLLAISELAYSGICTGQGDSVQLIFSNLPSDFETLGLMQSVPQLYVTQGENMSRNFLHLTVQEFLAALHISNMSPEKQLEHFQRQWDGRLRVVLRFLAGLTRLVNLPPNLLRGLLLKEPNTMRRKLSSCPEIGEAEHRFTHGYRYNTTTDVEVIIQHVRWMFEAQKDTIVPLVLQGKTVEFKCHEGLTPLDYYSLGYCIAQSHSQWVLTVEEIIIREEVLGKEEVRMLVAGASTRPDTTAKVVGLRGVHMGIGMHERMLAGMNNYGSGDYRPLSISAEALNVLFTELKNMIHLQELHLNLPAQCSSIAWPNLTGLRVIRLALTTKKSWKLSTLLSHLSLQSLTIEVTGEGYSLGPENAASIGKLFLSSNFPEHMYITDMKSVITAEVAVGQHVHEKQLNKTISLVEVNNSVECLRCRLDWYSLGCVIAHSNCQWVLTVEEGRWEKEDIGEEEVRMLVAGASTKHDTTAKVVGVRSRDMGMCLHGRIHFGVGLQERMLVRMGHYQSGDYRPLSIAAEALNVLFVDLKNIIHLQELYLNLPAQCSSIAWPYIYGIQVLHLALSSRMNWKLDISLAHLSLQSLTIEVIDGGDTLGPENAAFIGELFLSSNCPNHVYITDMKSPITAEVAVGRHVHEKQLDNRPSLVKKNKSVEGIRCHLDWYSLGCVIAHSNFQWVLTVEESRDNKYTLSSLVPWGMMQAKEEKKVIGEEEVRMLVVGASTRPDTTAKVVGLRGPHMDMGLHERMFFGMDHFENGICRPLSISAEALHMLFVELKDMIHLQELHLNLPAQCSSIPWPDLSGLRVLCLALTTKKSWKLSTLLPHLSLKSLTIEVAGDRNGLGLDNASSVGELFLSSNCPIHVHITDEQSPITAEVAVGQHVHEKPMDNTTPSVEENKSVEGIRCRLDWYSLGCVIAHSNCQWVLTVEEDRWGKEVMGEEEVRMLVAGASTRPDTAAKVVGLRGPHTDMGIYRRILVGMDHYDSGGYKPLSISPEALNVLFMELTNTIHLQELHLNLPAQCSSIAWPGLSELRVLHLALSSGMNWKLNTLLPHLSLRSLTIEVADGGGGLGLDNVASIGELFLSSNCLQHVHITDKQSPITAEVAVDQHVQEKQLESATSLAEEKRCVEGIRCRLDWYSLGYVIAHSNCQWVLTVERDRWGKKVIGKEEVRMLVAGASTKQDTSARVVGLKGSSVFDHYKPLSISAEALNVLLLELKSMIHLQELYLNLPAQCSSIRWCNLSGMRVLYIGIKDERNWRLDALLPHLSLESLTVESTKLGSTVALEDCRAIGMLLSSSKCLKCFQLNRVSIAPEGMQLITKAMSDNQSLPLRSLVVRGCTFSGTAAQPLALFITNSTTLHHLSIGWCTLSVHGLLELARAIHHSSSLQERELGYLRCTVDGDDEASAFAQLLVDYPHMVDWMFWGTRDVPLQCSRISDKGAQSIATVLHHNSTLSLLDLSNNSISDTGSAALAQALHHNSTLKWLFLSGNDAISTEGTRQLVQALTVNTSIRLALPKSCEKYATQCTLYCSVNSRIIWD